MTVKIVIAGAGDGQLLDRVAEGVFDNPIRPDMLTLFLEDPRHHLALAIENGEVVGMASANEYLHPDKDVQAWINEVGVAPAFRARGIATRLLGAMIERLRSRGLASVWVATEAGNDAARALYRKVGAEETEGVVMCELDLN